MVVRLDRLLPELIDVKQQLLLTAAIVLSGTVAACDSVGATAHVAVTRADSLAADSVARARQDSVNRAQPGYVIDSVRPIAEEVRRFSASIGGRPVMALAQASPSRDALVRRIVRDVVTGDTADLRATVVTPREFIDLIYPSSPYTHRPYEQPPGMVWMQIDNRSASGFTRLVRRRAHQPARLLGYACGPRPDRQGANTLWLNCTLRLSDEMSGTSSTQRWFGSIIERGGRFKVMSFANQF